MIPLRLRVDCEGDDPFVVRLAENPDHVSGPWDATLAFEEGDSAVYAGKGGSIRLSGIPAVELAGDILLVEPRRHVAHRLIRAQSRHNTFLITERCDQLCLMCSQPPKKHHSDLFSVFAQAALLAPRGMTIGITGGEPTLYKQELFAFLEHTMRARPDLQFHVLTNAQHFEDGDLAQLVRFSPERLLWGIPLYSADATLHDEIVGKQGAFHILKRSLSLLARAGASVELRTVVINPNADALEATSRFVSNHLPFINIWAIMQLENIGYGRKNWDWLFFDSGESFDPLAEAIDSALARGVAVALYNFPLCTVPPSYRSLAHVSISDWKRRYLEPCDSCSLRGGCGGFFAWYPEAKGFRGIRPE